jgi:hypothetical protein
MSALGIFKPSSSRLSSTSAAESPAAKAENMRNGLFL